MSRLLATMRRDATLQVRYRLVAVSAFMVLVWGGLLSFFAGNPDAGTVAAVVPAFLLNNLIVTTFYFVGALVLLEKDEGTLAAMVTTPLRDTEYLLSKAVTLTLLALAESLLVIVLLFGARFRWELLLAGGGLLGLLYVFAGFAVAVRYDSVNEWLFPSVPVVVFFLLPLLPHFGLTGRGLFLVHPAEPAMALLRAACSPSPPGGDVAYGLLGSLVWAGVAFLWARRQYDRFVVRGSR